MEQDFSSDARAPSATTARGPGAGCLVHVLLGEGAPGLPRARPRRRQELRVEPLLGPDLRGGCYAELDATLDPNVWCAIMVRYIYSVMVRHSMVRYI